MIRILSIELWKIKACLRNNLKVFRFQLNLIISSTISRERDIGVEFGGEIRQSRISNLDILSYNDGHNDGRDRGHYARNGLRVIYGRMAAADRLAASFR